MTLAQWATKYNVVVNQGFFMQDRCQYVPMFINHCDYWELYHLEDYLVSSVQAGTVWLVKRPAN